MNEDKTLFVDDIYIIAPQLLVVYEDLIHIDLFTVTPSERSNKDANQLCLGIIASGGFNFFQRVFGHPLKEVKILFDPNGILTAKQKNTTLSLTPLEFQDAVDDTVFVSILLECSTWK
ncbi:hypothetical protein [Lysinibacillus xylanilyticus]|uniref:hypothetical protein n=1 Tax=Lysinibacillus xylanilyticus TaxID=582475 RepID=UPI0037F6878E